MLIACRPPVGPGHSMQFVLAEADGQSLPALLDTIPGAHGHARHLTGAKLQLLSRGRLVWQREYLLAHLDPEAPASGLDGERLSGWYATEGSDFVMELLTGSVADGSTVTVHGELRDGVLELVIPLRIGVRMERYVHAR